MLDDLSRYGTPQEMSVRTMSVRTMRVTNQFWRASSVQSVETTKVDRLRRWRGSKSTLQHEILCSGYTHWCQSLVTCLRRYQYGYARTSTGLSSDGRGNLTHPLALMQWLPPHHLMRGFKQLHIPALFTAPPSRRRVPAWFPPHHTGTGLPAAPYIQAPFAVPPMLKQL
jgi:hypothetical protein